MSEPRRFLLVGGPGDGDILELCGEPSTYDVDGELYVRTQALAVTFYRHSSVLPAEAAERFMSKRSDE